MLRKVLAIDDSPLILQMYKLFFSRFKDCSFVTAANGLEALDKLGQEEGIDLILLDINMPVMNGLEFLERIRREPAYRGIPVIIISRGSRRTRSAGSTWAPRATYGSPSRQASWSSSSRKLSGARRSDPPPDGTSRR